MENEKWKMKDVDSTRDKRTDSIAVRKTEAVLLIDFGSTCTKVTAVDISRPRLLGNATSFTTVNTDVREGLSHALSELESQTGALQFNERFACSSAAGGLRMVVCGLAPELTAKAASMASLGAGAKVVGLYSYELTEDDIKEIEELTPDILLLTGGTDGGNKKCIQHNAEMLADSPGNYPIVVAGNRNCGRQVMSILKHRQAYICDNVLPKVDVLNIEPTRQLIREIFLERIVHAKGLSHAADMCGGILMPTPAAVLAAVELLATGCAGEPGIGDVIAIDVGGATTDFFSVAARTPRGLNVVYKGLIEPFAKRTVEGDIGMRYSANGIIEAAGLSRVAAVAKMSEAEVKKHAEHVTVHTNSLPQDPGQKAMDFALAAFAIETATQRHAGSIEEVYTATGRAYLQTGKDLSDVNRIIMTGGALLFTDRHSELVEYALYSDKQPQSLRPKQAETLIDRNYILAAAGLLSKHAPNAALELLKSNLHKN